MKRLRHLAWALLAGSCSVAGQSSAPTEATRLLQARSAEFDRVVLQVADNVYVADGYGVSPITMVVGQDGYFIVDAGVDPGLSRLARAEFEQRTHLPLQAVLFTHGHHDHVAGASAFVAPGEPVDVWAAGSFGAEDRWQDEAGLRIQHVRGRRQSGVTLPAAKRINNGIAPAFVPQRAPAPGQAAEPVRPGKLVEGPTEIEIAGVKVHLSLSPGETEDSMTVWLPQQRVAFAGDNFYKSWPNLYAIRGTGYRDVLAWIRSIDAIRAMKPRVLIGGHTKPIVGESEVDTVLGNYSRAIRHVFDETIKGMNAGRTADELASSIRLPPDLAELDYLRPYYGHPEWAVRSIFGAYLGWFDGNPTNLFRLPPVEEARRVVALAGGTSAVEAAANKAIAEGDTQWGLQLLDRLLALEPDDRALRQRKAAALEAIAEGTLTATARNYFLSYAQELRGDTLAPGAVPAQSRR